MLMCPDISLAQISLLRYKLFCLIAYLTLLLGLKIYLKMSSSIFPFCISHLIFPYLNRKHLYASNCLCQTFLNYIIIANVKTILSVLKWALLWSCPKFYFTVVRLVMTVFLQRPLIRKINRRLIKIIFSINPISQTQTNISTISTRSNTYGLCFIIVYGQARIQYKNL